MTCPLTQQSRALRADTCDTPCRLAYFPGKPKHTQPPAHRHTARRQIYTPQTEKYGKVKEGTTISSSPRPVLAISRATAQAGRHSNLVMNQYTARHRTPISLQRRVIASMISLQKVRKTYSKSRRNSIRIPNRTKTYLIHVPSRKCFVGLRD